MKWSTNTLMNLMNFDRNVVKLYIICYDTMKKKAGSIILT